MKLKEEHKVLFDRWMENLIPISYNVAEKLQRYSDYSDFTSLCPDSWYDFDDDLLREDYEMVERMEENGELVLTEEDISYRNLSALPAWGTLWAFDNHWMDDWVRNNLEAVHDCGFWVYDSEDYGCVLGINGAGYDFHSEHWIPLFYKMNDEYSPE